MDTLLGTAIGLAIGYMLGSQSGAAKMAELDDARVAWGKISKSEDFKALRSSVVPITRAILKNAISMFSGQNE